MFRKSLSPRIIFDEGLPCFELGKLEYYLWEKNTILKRRRELKNEQMVGKRHMKRQTRVRPVFLCWTAYIFFSLFSPIYVDFEVSDSNKSFFLLEIKYRCCLIATWSWISQLQRDVGFIGAKEMKSIRLGVVAQW